MDELVKTFHIDWKLLIAQIVNFGIVLGVLYFFALKPLLKVMAKRNQDITQSLQDAEAVKQKLHEAERTKEQIVTEAKQEAQIIIEKSYTAAEKLREQKLHETRRELEQLSEKAKHDIQSEQEKSLREAKAAVAELVVAASSKVLEKNIDYAANKRFIDETIEQVK